MPDPPDSIRRRYETHGAETYYRSFGVDYRNPHEPVVIASLSQAAKDGWLDLTHVLDLACGSGEVTLALRNVGAKCVDGIDPFTYDAYHARTGAAAERFTFADVAAGALAGRAYSLIVCSFAMHLCPPSRLPGLAQQLAQISPAMLILTPHKRPAIQPSWGWTLRDERLVNRVRTRLYRLTEGS